MTLLTKMLNERLAELTRERAIALEALRQIVASDYRGHPSTEQQIAHDALTKLTKPKGE